MRQTDTKRTADALKATYRASKITQNADFVFLPPINDYLKYILNKKNKRNNWKGNGRDDAEQRQ